LTNTFRARGIDARFVYEGTKQAERVETYQAFRAGEFPVLVNFGILTEGGAVLFYLAPFLSQALAFLLDRSTKYKILPPF
jgi:superfamily II DNA or RNA helicase